MIHKITKEISKKQRLHNRVLQFSTSLKRCKECGKLFWSSSYKEFCCKHCSKVFSGKLGAVVSKNSVKTLICSICGKEEQVICSYSPKDFLCKDCKKQKEYNSRIIPPTICVVCGKEFTWDCREDKRIRKTTPAKFCSKECARKFSSSKCQGKTKQIICIECGTQFTVDAHASGKTTRCPSCSKKRLHEKNIIYRKTNPKKYKSNSKYKKKIRTILWKKNDLLGRIKGNYIPTINIISKLNFNLKNNNIEEEVEKLKERLYNWYIKDKLSCEEIKASTGVSKDVIKRLLIYFDIPVRNASQASALAIQKGRKLKDFVREDFYKTGWHVDWQNQKWFLRSSYEARFAKILDTFRVNYKVESLYFTYLNTIKNKMQGAVPDFYLEDYDIIVETKGEHLYDEEDLLDRNKIISKEGYRFCIIQLTELEEIEKNINSLDELINYLKNHFLKKP